MLNVLISLSLSLSLLFRLQMSRPSTRVVAAARLHAAKRLNMQTVESRTELSFARSQAKPMNNVRPAAVTGALMVPRSLLVKSKEKKRKRSPETKAKPPTISVSKSFPTSLSSSANSDLNSPDLQRITRIQQEWTKIHQELPKDVTLEGSLSTDNQMTFMCHHPTECKRGKICPGVCRKVGVVFS